MRNVLQAHFHNTADQAAEASRHAYNAAFEELGLAWHWDAATYAKLQAHGRDAVRTYLETEQPHLLRAYEAQFLVEAVETARARCVASKACVQAHATPYARHSSDARSRLAA